MKLPKVEEEANAFACALLMPEKLFRREWDNLKDIKDEDERIIKMAKIFQVPLYAVVMRIQMLTTKFNVL